MITRAQTVDLTGGRGRLAPAPAASIARIDRALGRPADINSAWRDPIEQQRLRDDYLRDPNNNPIALPPDESVHCVGYAVDSDDWYAPTAAAVWRDHGWRQTVYRTVNGRRALVEPWHGEYNPYLDNHRSEQEKAMDEAAKEWMRLMVRQELGGALKAFLANVPDKDWAREMVRQELGGALSLRDD
ncbi:M15 family metallopeptidase domain-containing protein [Microbacterium sp. GXF7504]